MPCYYPRVVPRVDEDEPFDGIDISFGIEEFYTDSETAQALDDELQKGKKIPVVVMIDAEGNARIRSVARASQTPHSKKATRLESNNLGCHCELLGQGCCKHASVKTLNNRFIRSRE